MEETTLTELLDFSQWTLHDIKDLRVLTDEELKEAEDNLTNYIDEMSQFDHVCLVLTYKEKIRHLQSEINWKQAEAEHIKETLG